MVVATPEGLEPATFSLEGIGVSRYFTAILTKRSFRTALTVNA